MPNEESWSVISVPTSNSLILGVDFPAAGRREAGFADLVANMGPAWSGHGFLQTTLPAVRVSERPTGDFYTEQWMRGGDWEKYEVVAVLGYCLGGVYAAEIAERVARRQGTEPQVVLFDAQVTDIQLLAAEVNKMVGLAGPVFSGEEAEQARKNAAEIVGRPSITITDAAIEIVELYREIASTAFRRIGLSDARRDEVVKLFETYMSWLSAAVDIDPCLTWKRSLAITSADYAALERNGAATAVDATKMLGRRISLDTSHADLLRDDATVRTLLDHVEF
ncbi:hypothetical protein ACFV6Z_37575 [Streptomyces sp. NPDC059818]|uniref:hypothetical protein n=1 Tax=Streptomyces sp. NPDC059818 TaxID=3346962 RepID=UPI00365686DE